MSIVVNTNVSSMVVQRSLNNATTDLSTSLERLSTGYKINKAADDAAGLTISEGLESQERGADVASSNAQHGVNLLQTAEGDLSVIQDNLQRIRDLTVQAANGTYGSSERAAIQEEVEARVTEINRLASVSSFSAINLLDGSASGITLQIGANSGSNNQINISSALTAADASSLGITSSTVTTAFASALQSSSFIDTIDSAISDISEQRSDIGALQNRLDSTIESLSISEENLSAANSRIRDVDVAEEATSMTTSQILQQASTSVLSQANQTPSIALSLI